ncbi:MAG TPA: LysM peptidoglycan-binding domain-containing protein [Anaerolineales bacterium]|nr:LysM peptidoglycan-binding domain-containing protein [Anaerolineales bacterium]HNA87947.1 LysM peptidoglycan-binding domain-containing protein [Anaerolineales bacterium]HNB35620.1 LysM peptidoglycan-binding domain-containing protein [Anaerolineales bacterium]
MQGLRDFGSALIVAVVSVGLMLGALSISLVEFVPAATSTVTQAVILSPVPVTATSTLSPTPTLSTGIILTTATFTATNTVIPPTFCQPPAGWIPVTVQGGDTLEGLAVRYQTTKELLKNGNCLTTESLVTGTILYVPPSPTSTAIICVQGAAGWSKSYVVKPGDTLYSIAVNHYTTASAMRQANCRSGDVIYINEILWVPNVATRTPTFTPLPGITITITSYPTEPLTETVLPFTGTPSATLTPILPTSTTPPTLTPVPTQTASPTAFPTATPTP